MGAAIPAKTDRPVLVFLHGGGLNREMWRPQQDALQEEFRVLTMDLPGHGARRDERFTLDAAVETVAKIVNEADAAPAVLVGLSLGGYVAMAFADRHPEMARGLVLSGCSVQYRGLLGLVARANGWLLKGLSQPRFERGQAARLRKQFPAALAEAIIAEGFGVRATADSLLQVVGVDFNGMLRAYPGPALVLNGERDPLNRRMEATQAACLQSGRVEFIRDAGHLCSMEKPDAFTDALRTFARSLPARLDETRHA